MAISMIPYEALVILTQANRVSHLITPTYLHNKSLFWLHEKEGLALYEITCYKSISCMIHSTYAACNLLG